MTLPTIYPTQYSGTGSGLTNDFLKVKADKSGSARTYAGTVTVPSGTATSTIIGLTPFNKGARFSIGDKSVYCSNWGASGTTIDLGYVYNDNTTYTNNADAWASGATAPAAGGFVTVDEPDGISFVAEADGWVAITVGGANADADGTITFNFPGSYDGLGLNNSNNQN